MPEPPRRDPVAAAMLRGFRWLVRSSLRGVWWRGSPPPGPFVWAANHHSWWDPFVAAALLETWRRPSCLLLAQENLERYRFVRRLGGFGTHQRRDGLAFLRAGRVLVIYPEGELRPPGPPGPLAAGAAWFARTGEVPLYAAATRVLVRGQQAPEAYVSLVPVTGPPVGAGEPATQPAAAGEPTADLAAGRRSAGVVRALTERLADTLSSELAAIDAEVAGSDPRRPLAGFTQVVGGRHSWDERIDRVNGWLPWHRDR